MGKADLHTHTTASDGDYPPEKLVKHSQARGLLAVAITDHDTTKGVPEGLKAAQSLDIRVIPGIEISAVYDPGTLHILGYFREFPGGLEDDLERIQKGRLDRFPKIIERLNGLGLNLTLDDVTMIAGDAQIGRPHIAKALIKKGYVKDFDDAFDRFLGKGRPAYVEKEKLTWQESIDLIRRHNGISVLAHPFTLELKDAMLKKLVFSMKAAGLGGIEVHYPEHTREQTKLYKAIAQEAGLVVTGGTDFHTPDRGAPLGDCGIGEDALDVLLNLLSTN